MKKIASSNSATSSKSTSSRSDSPVGKMLRRWREDKGLTQEQAADILGIGRGALAQWESGRRAPILDAKTLPGFLRVFQESGLVSGPVQMPEGMSMEEMETRVTQLVRAAVGQAFTEFKETNSAPVASDPESVGE
jgi:transcriptional regulator with XRE-family HTH domain